MATMEKRRAPADSSVFASEHIDSNSGPSIRSTSTAIFNMARSSTVSVPGFPRTKPSAFTEVCEGTNDGYTFAEIGDHRVLPSAFWKKRALHSASLFPPSMVGVCRGEASSSSNNLDVQLQRDRTARSGPDIKTPETAIVRRHRRKPPTGVLLTCRVCGDDACGYNFDALTCHSCKLFFRRNAYRTLTCPFTGHCQMDRRSRKFCASCRLKKCFTVGMLRELIKLRYVQKNYHQKSAGADSMSASQEADPSPSTSPRLTPPDTPDSVDRSAVDPAASRASATPRSSNACGESLAEQKRPFPSGFSEPASVAPKRPNLQTDAPLQNNAIAQSSVAQSFLDALRGMFAPSFESSALSVGEFGSPASMSSAAYSCATPASSSCAPSSVGTRCSSTMKPRTRSVLSEYEYDTLLLQCHSFWQSLSPTMLESDVFAQIIDKSVSPQHVVCGPTTVSIRVESGNYVCTYFELGIRRAIAALRLVTDFADMPADSQMKLLKAGLLSVLNVISMSTFDKTNKSWTIRITRDHSHRFSANEEAGRQDASQLTGSVFREFLERLGTFHSGIRERFTEDYVPVVTMALIQLFDPARFESESESPQFISQLRRVQRKHINFLRKYIHRHYRSNGAACMEDKMLLDEDTDGQGENSKSSFNASEECRAHVLLRFCIDQLATSVRVLEQVAQQISTQFLVPQTTSERDSER